MCIDMTKEELVYRLASIFPQWMTKEHWLHFVGQIEKGGLEFTEKEGWMPPPEPPSEKGKVIDMGNTISEARPINAPPPILVDMRNYQRDKLITTILKKHREDKGEE